MIEIIIDAINKFLERLDAIVDQLKRIADRLND